jgi:hypothetical protein
MRAAAIRIRKIRKIFTVVNSYRIKTSTRTKILRQSCCEFLQSEKLILHQKPPLFKNRSFLRGDFKNFKSVGVWRV